MMAMAVAMASVLDSWGAVDDSQARSLCPDEFHLERL
jgi:hypothetical protein